VRLKIDDAVDAIPVHFFCGIWGCIATGIFASDRLVGLAYGPADKGGILYGGGVLLGIEIAGVLFVIAWTGGIMIPFFLILKALGLFRVDPTEEKVGLDISHHKGAAYDLTAADKTDIEEMIEKRSLH